MPRVNTALLAFNRGLVSPKALARVDLERMPFSAEIQENWMPRTLGSMSLRPGLEYIGDSSSENGSYLVPFVYSTEDTAILEFEDELMYVWVDDELVTFPSVSTQTANGTFPTDLTSWVDADDASGVSTWVSGMNLVGDGTDYARRTQQVTVGGGDLNVEHSLRVNVDKGVAIIRAGSTSGAKDYIDDINLSPGEYRFSITPTTDVFIEVEANLARSTLVSAVVFETGIMEIDNSPEIDESTLRHTQSADVVFTSNGSSVQRVVKRYGTRSWGIATYETEDGPFGDINISTTTMTASALTGDITITASADTFTSNQVGSLIRADSVGQTVEVVGSAENVWTDPIVVTGTGTARTFLLTIAGTVGSTYTLQRSVAAPGAWQDVISWTAPGSLNLNYALDNQIIYYRFGIKTGDYTAGSADLSLVYSGGSIVGIGRITGYTSATVVSVEVLKAFGNTDSTDVWYEALWSDKKGYPTAVALHEGRLWWAGRQYWYGSVSDQYYSFDADVVGDSAPIIRRIGYGAVDDIKWLLPGQRLMAGNAGAVISARSSSFEEPLTKTNFNLRDSISHGSSNTSAVRIGDRGFYIDNSMTRLLELVFNRKSYSHDAVDLTVLNPDLFFNGVSKILVQHTPDNRIHCISDKVYVFVTDPAEDVGAWVSLRTGEDQGGHAITDGVVLPSVDGDRVYYMVDDGSSRYLYKMALESECVGGNINKQADGFVQDSGQIITIPARYGSQFLSVWADGKDLGLFQQSGGTIDLGASYTNVIYGYPYEATFKSSKLAYAAGMGTALTQKKKVPSVGLVLQETHHDGVKYGTDPDDLASLPTFEDGEAVAVDSIWEHYDAPSNPISSSWETDARLYITASSPRPATVLAAVLTVVTHDKS